jgi:general secretion pathway protein C
MNSEVKWPDLSSLDGARLLTIANQHLPGMISLLLVALIGWQLARIGWMLVPASSIGDDIAAPTTRSLPASSVTAPDVQAIANAHIFGIASAEPTVTAQPAATETDNLRDTRLTNLALKGTIVATAEEQAVAIIADGGGEEKVYGIGDPVTSGAKLHAIYADRVVLNENGILTNLKLPRDFPEGTRLVDRRTRTATSRTSTATQSIQSVLTNNATQLADVIRPTPYFADGQQQGYKVYPGRNRQQFASLGLRPGDLIKDIDGQALTDPTQAIQIFQTLGTADQVAVTIERNGQQQSLVLSTSQFDFGDENTK